MKRPARVLANEYQTPTGKESVSRQSLLERGSVKSTATGVLKEVNRNLWVPEPLGGQMNGTMSSKSGISSQKSSQVYIQRPPFYPEPEQLEHLVYKKEELVGSLKQNETAIEEKIAMLGSQKKTIREEQNALLRELEELGLKLKDFEGNSFNLKYCTVISPYCNRFGQQVLARLRGVCENLSDKETKAEIVRAIQSIQSLRERREEHSVELCALDLAAATENEAAQREKLVQCDEHKHKLEMQLHDAKLSLEAVTEELNHKTSYLEAWKGAFEKKNAKGVEVGAVKLEIEQLTQDRDRLEATRKDLIGEASLLKLQKSEWFEKVKQAANDFQEKGGRAKLREEAKKAGDTLKPLQFLREILLELFTDLKELEVSKAIEKEWIQLSHLECHHLITREVLQVVGKVMSMVSLENALGALSKSQTQILQIVQQTNFPGSQNETLVVYQTILSKAEAYIKKREEQLEFPQKELCAEAEASVKSLLNEMLKGIEGVYPVLKGKLKVFEQWDAVTEKLTEVEQAIDALGKKHNDIVEKIQSARDEQRKAALELNKIMLENSKSQVCKPQSRPASNTNTPPCKLLTDVDLEESRFEDGGFEDSVYIDEAAIGADDGQSGEQRAGPEDLPLEGWEIKECYKQVENAKKKVEKLESELQATIQSYGQAFAELEAFSKHKEGTTTKVKSLRKDLADGLANEVKELGVISNLLDYMNKPVLSRDLGVGIVDGLTTDLASLIQQTNTEINRQKRILKLVGKGEDYSHEERVYEEMLSENINRIRDELGRLNEDRIPRLKEVEQAVGALEADNMVLRDSLHQTLDTIEQTEQTFLTKLAADVQKGAITEKDIELLFQSCYKLLESGYPEYVISRVYPQEDWSGAPIDRSAVENYAGHQANTILPKLRNSIHFEGPFGGAAGAEGHYGQPQYTHDLNSFRSEQRGQNYSGHSSQVHHAQQLQHEEMDEAADETEADSRINEAIIRAHPKKLFSKVLATFAADYSLYRTRVLSKLAEGVVVCKQTKVMIGRTLCPIKYWEESQKKKKPQLETYGYQKQLLKFDWDQGKLLFYSNKPKQPVGIGKHKQGEEDTGIVARWVLEDEIELDDFIDIALPDTSNKLIKSRLTEFYKPSQLGVYNQAELAALQTCPFVQFSLEFEGRTRVECLAHDFGIFLDIYVGLMFLQHE